MKIKRLFEEYYEELGYDDYITNYLSKAYQIWCAAEGLELLDANEHDRTKLTKEQKEFLDSFINFWDIASVFEDKYDNEKYIPELRAKKYNL